MVIIIPTVEGLYLGFGVCCPLVVLVSYQFTKTAGMCSGVSMVMVAFGLDVSSLNGQGAETSYNQ